MGPPRATFHGFIVTQSEMGLSSRREADLDPPHLRKKDPGKDDSPVFVPGRKIEPDLEGIRVAEGVALPLALEPGKPLRVPSVQGFPKGSVEVLQCLLLGVDRAERQKAVLLARPPQGQELGQVSVGQERHPRVKPFRLEIEGLVPHEPDASRMAGENAVLFGGRTKTEFEGLPCFHVIHHAWSYGQVNGT